jgi:hypothetical protein
MSEMNSANQSIEPCLIIPNRLPVGTTSNRPRCTRNTKRVSRARIPINSPFEHGTIFSPQWCSVIRDSLRPTRLLPHYRHPCKSLSTEKHELSVRALESALLIRSGAAAAHVCLSAGGSCTLQNRTSICCLRLRKSRRRRLSLDSLPVPKQFEESHGSRLRRPAGNLRDLAACASIDPDVFPFSARFYAAAVRRNSAAGM